MNTHEKRIFGTGLVFVIGLSLFLAHTVLGVRIDRVLRDKISDTHIRNEAVIVGIDDASLQAIGAWPWKRDTFAIAIDTLYKKGARLVVLDILFLEKREGDEDLLRALNTHKKPVIFASKLDKQGFLLTSVYGSSSYALHGIAHVYPDDDGKVRTINFSQKDTSANCYESLAYKAFLTYTRQDTLVCDTDSRPFLFQATAPVTVSFIDVIRGSISDEVLKDKVIFIGSNSLDVEDHFIGANGEKIPGVYVHTSIFTTLLNNSFLKEVSRGVYIVLILIFLIGIISGIFRLKNIYTQGILLIVGATLIVVITLLSLTLHYNFSLSFILFPYIFCSLYAILFRYGMTEKKNSYIKELFGQYVHPKVLANILKDNNLKLGGEKKYITILFSDIRGFTTLTEKMPPEKLVETLNLYLEKMSPIIMNNEGVIDKYIGDAIMAFWNAPVDVHHHEEKAVRASLLMIEALKNMKTDTLLEIGIGLHAGDAIVGNIGSRSRINYTIIGDAVNACSRLEGLTKKYGLQIIVSEQIKNAISAPDIFWRTIDTVRVKGKSEVMKLYEPMIRTKENEHTVTIANKAFMNYIQGDFVGAKSLYKSLDDTYSEKMTERIDQLLTSHQTSWDGVWNWDEK